MKTQAELYHPSIFAPCITKERSEDMNLLDCGEITLAIALFCCVFYDFDVKWQAPIKFLLAIVGALILIDVGL